MALTISLAEYLLSASRRPFQWGQCDCCMFAADWVHAMRGFDPADILRGSYTSEAEAALIIMREGGMRAFAISRLASIGLLETKKPTEGDIGIVKATDGETFAIKTSRYNWACKGRKGIVIAPFEMLLAWSI